MKLNKIITLAILIVCSIVSYAQNFDKDDQYTQAMNNAKTALEAQQYSQAVMFYREALSLKPEALLPKYKIEDIRTIYIKNELEELQKETPMVTEKPKSKKKQKELEAKEEVLVQKAEEIATEKMYQEADLAKEELVELVQESEFLNIIDSAIMIEDQEDVQNIEPDRETTLVTIESKKTHGIVGEKTKTASSLTVSKQELSEIKASNPNEPKIENEQEKPQIEKSEAKQITPVNKPVKKQEVIKDEEWIKAENGRLAKKYPNQKTIEEIEKPGKHITRVIMNIDGKITTYLKVKHSWGATFFFVDEVGLELRSISQTHYNLMTDLSTYKKK